MTANVTFEYEQAFKAECKVIDLKQEYTHYCEDVRWAIATDLSEIELRAKYGSLIKQYEPFMLLTKEHARIMVEFHSNERKHKKRSAELGDAFGYEDDLFEKFHPELIEDPFAEKFDPKTIYRALEHLGASQRDRVVKHYLDGISIADIAAAEGVSSQAVQQSIARSLKTLKKFLI